MSETLIGNVRGLQGERGPQGLTGETGATGPQGPAGQQGETGPAGVGVPAGGTAGQMLVKTDGTDYNTRWITPALTQNAGYFDIEADAIGMVKVSNINSIPDNTYGYLRFHAAGDVSTPAPIVLFQNDRARCSAITLFGVYTDEKYYAITQINSDDSTSAMMKGKCQYFKINGALFISGYEVYAKTDTAVGSGKGHLFCECPNYNNMMFDITNAGFMVSTPSANLKFYMCCDEVHGVYLYSQSSGGYTDNVEIPTTKVATGTLVLPQYVFLNLGCNVYYCNVWKSGTSSLTLAKVTFEVTASSFADHSATVKVTFEEVNSGDDFSQGGYYITRPSWVLG